MSANFSRTRSYQRLRAIVQMQDKALLHPVSRTAVCLCIQCIQFTVSNIMNEAQTDMLCDIKDTMSMNDIRGKGTDVQKTRISTDKISLPEV